MPKKRTKNKKYNSNQKVPLPQKNNLATKELSNKPFWALLAILFLTSFLTLTTITEENSTLTGNIAIQVISYQQGGSNLFFEIRNVKNLKDATATLSETIKGGKIIFKEPDLRPSFDGTFISAFTIESADEKKIQQLDLTLKIKESDIKQAKLLPAEIIVYRDNKQLPTILSYSKDDYVYYTTTTTTLGTFVIGKQKLKIAPSQPQLVIESSTSQQPTQPATEEPQPPILEQPKPITVTIEPKKQPEEPITPSPKLSFWQKIKSFFNE